MTVGTWGSGANLIQLAGELVAISSDEQVIQGTRVNNNEIDRQTRKGQAGIRIGDLSGGLSRVGGIGDIRTNLNQYAKSEGVWTITPGLAYPPYLPTIQTSMTSDIDISAITAANHRVHSVNSPLGVAGQRWLAGVKTMLLGDTSLTDSALVVRDTFTNNITATSHLRLNSTDYLAFATDGQTDDLKGTVSVTGSGAPTWVELVTHSNAADVIRAMAYYPGLGPGINVFVGTIGNVNQVWYALATATVPATLLPVVQSETKDIEGTLATTSTAATSPAYAYQLRNSGATIGELAEDQEWDTPSNVLASDNAYASVDMSGAAANERSNFLGAAWDGLWTAIPLANIITGIKVEIEHKEDNAADNAYAAVVRLKVNGSQVGITLSSNAELGTADAYETFGSDTARWGVELTGKDIQNIVVEWQYTTSGDPITVDHIRMTLTHRPPGTATAIAAPQGGYALPAMPNFANRMVILEPTVTDSTAITVPRRMVYYDFEWDQEGNRATAKKSYPDVGGLAYIHHGTPISGGYAVTGGPSAGPGVDVHILREDGKVVDTRIPTTNGTTVYKCNTLFTLKGFLCAQMVASDFTDYQYWLFDLDKNVWHTPTLLQSKSGTTVTTQPIPYAEAVLNLQQNRIYTIFPNGTDTGVRREFMPPNPNADPRLANTTEVKYASTISIQTMEMYAGYADASNTIVALDYQERRIGASGSDTGTVRVLIDTGGDAVVTSAEVDTTFTAGLHATVASRGHYDVPSSGQAYQTMIVKITLDQGSGSTTSGPNGLPILITTVQEWGDDLRVFDIQLERTGHSDASILSTLEALETLKKTKNIQPLKFGEVNVNASYDRVVRYEDWLSGRGAAVTAASVRQPPVVRFLEKPGTV